MASKNNLNELRQSKEYGWKVKSNEVTKIQDRQNDAKNDHKERDEKGRKKKEKDPQSFNQIVAEIGSKVLLLRKMYPNNQEFGAKVAELLQKKQNQMDQ